MAFIQQGGKALGLLRTVETVQKTMMKIKQLSSDIKSQIASMTKFKVDVTAINSKILEIQENVKIYYALLETVSLTRNIQIKHLQAQLTCCESELTKTLDKLATVTQGETVAESKSQGIIDDLKKQIQNSKQEIEKLKKAIQGAEIEKAETNRKVQFLNTETEKLKSELTNTMTELSNLAKGIQIQGEGNLFVGGATQGPPGAGKKVKVTKFNIDPVVQKKIGQVIKNKTFTYGDLLQQLDTIKTNAENTKINIEQFLKTELQMNIDEFVTNEKFKKMVSNKTIPVDLRYTAETVQIKYEKIRVFRTIEDNKSYSRAKLYYYNKDGNKDGNKTSFVDPIAIKLGATHIFDNEKIFKAAPGQTFAITKGKIDLNKKSDKVPNQLVWCMNKKTKEVNPVYFNTQTKQYSKDKPDGIIFANDTFVIDPPVCSCTNVSKIQALETSVDAKKQLLGNKKAAVAEEERKRKLQEEEEERKRKLQLAKKSSPKPKKPSPGKKGKKVKGNKTSTYTQMMEKATGKTGMNLNKNQEGYVINEEGIVHLDNLSESIDLPTIYNYRHQ